MVVEDERKGRSVGGAFLVRSEQEDSLVFKLAQQMAVAWVSERVEFWREAFQVLGKVFQRSLTRGSIWREEIIKSADVSIVLLLFDISGLYLGPDFDFCPLRLSRREFSLLF